MTDECHETSQLITEECFDTENTTVSQEVVNKTPDEDVVTPSHEIDSVTEKTSAEKLVELVMNKVAAMKSSDNAETLTTDTKPVQSNHGHVMKSNNQMFQPRINNFFMFNFNVKETK